MIIALSGKMKVGKTTLAGIINKFLPVWHAPHSFGDEVKVECSKLLNVPKSLLYDQDGKELTVAAPPGVLTHFGLTGDQPVWLTLRKAMQLRGETARAEQPGYWVYRLHERIHDLANVIIDDVRYPDEAEYVRSRGGFLVRVHPHEYWQAGPHADHESETALDDWTDWNMQVHPLFCHLEPEAQKIATRIKEIEQ